MKALQFQSDVLRQTNRYSAKLELPDYPRLADGTLDREEALRVMLYEEYGFVNDEGLTVRTEVKEVLENQFAGKCRQTTLLFTFEKNGDSSSFPVHMYVPYGNPNYEMVIEINFHPELPNKYFPIEELMDRGIAVAHFNYKDVTSDDNDFTNGIARLLSDRNDPHSAGKIALWSYTASQIATYLLENGYADPARLYVAGHSRLGKTALLTAARDERFVGALVNCSGSCGAAIAREKLGETVAKICKTFPYWFCTHFHQYANRENEMPFDQHYLGALVAPRKLCIVTAEKDTWADTDAQYLMAEAADVIYREMGLVGLACKGEMLPQGKCTTEGRIGFQKRAGEHFFSRDDWNFFIDYIRK
ncbi:MAG: hypothetical protein IJW50_01020 [Clostridia bacterium]|nr:hypothetical protein [Clostridia bacterium]